MQKIILDEKNTRREVNLALKSTEEEMLSLTKSNRKLEEQIITHQIELKHIRRENFNLISDIKIYKKRLEEFPELEVMLDRLRDKDEQLKLMDDEAIENEQLIQKFEEELDKKQSKINDLGIKIGSKTEEIHQLKYKLNEYQKRSEKISGNEKKIEILILENEKFREIIKMSSSKVNTSVLTNKDFSESQLGMFENQIEDLRKLVARLRKELKQLKRKYEEALKEVKFWQRKRDEVADKLNDLESLYQDKVEENTKKAMIISKMVMKLFMLTCALKHSQNQILKLQS